MTSLYAYLIFTVCYLPNICVLIIIGSTSERRNDLQHLHFYTLTLLFLNSTLNSLIYCWKVKQIRHTVIATHCEIYCQVTFNPLSPNIHIQILQTDVHTSPLRISWENLIKDHGIFPMMIILLILITLSLDSVWILLGENFCWSLLGLKGLTKPLGGFGTPYQVETGVKQFNLREIPAFLSYTNHTKFKRASVWCVLPLKLFHLFSPTKYYLVMKNITDFMTV